MYIKMLNQFKPLHSIPDKRSKYLFKILQILLCITDFLLAVLSQILVKSALSQIHKNFKYF